MGLRRKAVGASGVLSRLADGAQYCSAHRLADLVCWHRCACGQRHSRRHSNTALAYHLHTIVLKMVEALGFTSAATAGLRQDILRFHQGQPYSEARSHAPKSSAATALRLSWNGRPVNSTLLLALLLADAISSLYRLILEERCAPTSLAHRLAALTLVTGLVRDTPAQLLLTRSSTLRPRISGQLCSCYQTSCPLVSLCQSSTLSCGMPGLGGRLVLSTAWKRASGCFTSMAHVRDR